MYALDVVDAVVVEVCDGASAVGFLSEGFEFAETDCSGDVVHAVVETDACVEVLIGFAVGAEVSDFGREFFVVGGEHAAFTGA